MKKDKGFTLIELLAVIVILAIIALISSPIIIGLIEDARKSAAANSAYGVYHSAENIYSKTLLASRNGLPDKLIYTFQSDGSTVISYGTLAVTDMPVSWGMDVNDVTLTFNGTKPTGGVLTLNKNGSVTIDSALIISGFTCTQTNGEFECGE